MSTILKKQRKLTNREKQNGPDVIVPDRDCKNIWVGEWECFHTGDRHTVTANYLVKMGQEAVQWCKDNPEAFHLCEFFALKGIANNTWQSWREKNESFDRACHECKRYLGRRREKGAMKKDYSEKMVMHTLHLYLDEVKRVEEWRAGLRTPEENEAGNKQYIIIEKSADTSIVKPRRDSDE